MPAPASARPGRPPDSALQDLWQQRLLRFARSGLSVVAFCAKEAVSAPSFYAWRRRLSQPPAESDARFVPVRVLPATAPVELLLPGGLALRFAPGCDLDFVRSLVAILGGHPC
jgi:transposase